MSAVFHFGPEFQTSLTDLSFTSRSDQDSFLNKGSLLSDLSTDEHPKYQGDFSMTAFSRILAVYLLTQLIMIMCKGESPSLVQKS